MAKDYAKELRFFYECTAALTLRKHSGTCQTARQNPSIYFAECAQMPIHSEADKSSKQVKKAGKLLRYFKQFGLSGDEGNKRRE